MTHSMRVDLQCPVDECEGTLTATISDAIDNLEDAGCGHAERLWARQAPDMTAGERQTALAMAHLLTDAIWQAVGDKEEALYSRHIDNLIDRRLGK